MKKKLRIVLIVLFACCLAVSLYMILSQLGEYAEGDRAYDELQVYIGKPPAESEPPAVSSEPSEPAPEEGILWPEVDFAALAEINPDIVGWIYIEDTRVNYPIVQGDDNEHYMTHLFSGKYNSSGCIFLDSRVEPDFSSWHSILYGHHMKNGTMFYDLRNYKQQEFFDEHPRALLLTPDGNYTVEFFSGCVASVESSAWDIAFASETEYASWLTSLKTRSLFQTDLAPAPTDRVLTLSTCSYEFDNARFVLHGILREAE